MKRTIYVTTLLVALALPVSAVASEAVQNLDLVTAYSNALERNFRIREGEARIGAREEGVNQAFSAVKPQVEATASYGTSDYRRNISGFQGRDTERDRESHRRLDLSVGQVLYSRSAFSGISEARADVDRTEKELESQVTDLQLDVIEQYMSVLRAERQLEIAEDELESHRRRLERVEGMQERGFATRGDRLEAQARIDQANTQVLRLRNQASTARNRLAQHTGTRFERVESVNDQLWRRTPELMAREDWRRLVLDNAASIEQGRAEVRFQESRRESARAEHYPELHLRARYTDNDTFATNLRREARVALELSMPLYTGGRVSASARAAEHELDAAEFGLRHERERLRVDLSDILQNLDGSYTGIRSLRASLESATAALDEAQSGFNAGVRDLSDVLDARNRVSEIRQEIAAETYANLFHQFELLVISGSLDQEALAVMLTAQSR